MDTTKDSTVELVSLRAKLDSEECQSLKETEFLADTNEFLRNENRRLRDNLTKYEQDYRAAATEFRVPCPEPGTDAVCMPPVSAEGMTCPDCDGRGHGLIYPENKCGFCEGTGHVLRDHK